MDLYELKRIIKYLRKRYISELDFEIIDIKEYNIKNNVLKEIEDEVNLN